MITNTHTYELTNCFDGAITSRNHFTDTIHGSFTLPQQETISIQLFDSGGGLVQAAGQRAITAMNVMRSRIKLIIEKIIK